MLPLIFKLLSKNLGRKNIHRLVDSDYLRKTGSACTFFRTIIENKFKEFPFGEKQTENSFWQPVIERHTQNMDSVVLLVLSILTYKNIPKDQRYVLEVVRLQAVFSSFCLTTSSHISPAARQASARGSPLQGATGGARAGETEAPTTWLHSNSICYLWLFVCFYCRMSQKTIWF